jgi:hypothetical protein
MRPPMVVVVTAKELIEAGKWVEKHVAEVHKGNLPYADISLRTFSGGGLTMRCVVTCEACDRVPGHAGRRENYHEITDYDSV